MSAPSLRARLRAEMTEEIKNVARRHLATHGADLSLRAVARDLGMVSSGIYRYFASRDELLTALILDAYEQLGTAVEQGEAAAPRDDLRARWFAATRAARRWALDHPAEYALIYGTPVPGYAAPPDTTGPAQRPAVTLVMIVVDGIRTGRMTAPDDELPASVRRDLAKLTRDYFPDVPETLMARGMAGWTLLFGLINFELFGRLHTAIVDYEAYFDHQMTLMAELIGLP